MIILAYFDPPERTVYSDENFAVIGRALTVATQFESKCKTVACSILGYEKRHLIDNPDDYEQFINNLRPQQLKPSIDKFNSNIIKALQEGGMSDDIIEAFNETIIKPMKEGREARNFIAHESTIGILHKVEGDDFRQTTIPLIKEKIEQVAKADYHISVFIENGINKRPTHPNREDYVERITKWVFEIYD